MFIGHWAPALAAAAATPKAPRLGILFIAAQFVDWAFFVFAIAGIERMRLLDDPIGFNRWDLYHYPYSHSLIGNFVFAAIFAAVIWFTTKDRSASLIAGGVALSHWFLDVLSHSNDMTIAGGEPKLGLELLDYPWLAAPVELLITLGALAWYARRTEGKRMPIAILAITLVCLQAVHWFGEQASVVTNAMHLTALLAFTIVTVIAWRVGQTRSYCASRG